MASEHIVTNVSENENDFDFKELLAQILIHWKWIAFSIICCLICAAIYLRSTTPVYRIQATVMINDELKGTYQNQVKVLQQDFGIMNTSGGIDNEIEIFRSKSIIKQAILDLDLYMLYNMKDGMRNWDIYGKYPINAYISREDLDALNNAFTFSISKLDSLSYSIEYTYVDPTSREEIKFEKEVPIFPYTLPTPIGDIYLSKGEAKDLEADQKLSISVVPPMKMAKSYLGRLSIEPTSKLTSIAYISFLDSNKKRGVDFVNSLITVYNRENNNDKNIVAIKTEEFLKERLELVEKELDDTEYQIAEYKQELGLTNISGDAQKMLEGSSEYEKKRVEITTQLSLVTYLNEYINNPKNDLQAIPVNMGLTDATLTSFISKYNEGVVERNRLLRTASESNPAVVDITLRLNQMAETIKASIESLCKSLTIKKRDINEQAAKFEKKIGVAPTQEKVLAGYMRKQEVKSGLYLMLLQKREENAIALKITSDNAKIIDAAYPNDAPVSPKRKSIWLIALVMGCAIPVGIIYLKNLLDYKIKNLKDLEKLTTIPVLGYATVVNNLKKGKRSIVVHENNNDTIAEAFRSIRTNLRFFLDSPEKKVIQFTSTMSGEGKTFISSNLAMSMALLGKKVVLVGLDIRKPHFAEMFGFSDLKSGVTMFLAGDPNDKKLLLSQIRPSGINENLDVLPAGIIPPNPTELLSKVNLENAIKFLKEEYDYIIIDTAPVGPVADTLIIAPFADATIYVCRANYTAKDDLQLLNHLYAESTLKNVSIVLNGVDMSKDKYGHYYGRYGRYGRYGQQGYTDYKQ